MGGAVALKPAVPLPGVAVGARLTKARPVSSAWPAWSQQGCRRADGPARPAGRGFPWGGRPAAAWAAPGRTPQNPTPLSRGVAATAMRSDMEDLLSKKPFLANPPSKCSLTASFGSQKCMYESIHLLWTTLWIMCKTFGKSQVPLGGRPVFSETFMQNSRKFGWSERTKGKIPCKNDEILTARSQKVTKRIPLCLRSCGK